MTLADETSAPPVPAAVPIIEVPALPLPRRLASLDIFRGITIAAMLLVNNQGIGKAYAPLEHAEWNGWTPTDLIFPFFLFIVGVAIPFSQSKRAAIGAGRGTLLAGIWTRALALVMLGLLLQGTPFRDITPLPDGYNVLRILRVVTYVFLGLGFVALLFPWRRRRLSLWLPPIVAILYLLLAVAIHFANRHALQSGLPDNFNFGNGLFTPWKLRIPGVLQRIGICYGVAASIALFAGWRTILAAAVLFMTAYSSLMLMAPYRDHAVGSLTREDNLARRIDEDVFRTHNYAAYPDPEGLLSTLPAIGSVLLGILVGYWLRSDRAAAERCAGLLAMGVVVAILGQCLDAWLMPINKQIWTPSFTVFTAGMGMLGLGAIFWFADVRGRRAWAVPFTIYGMNAIAAFVVAGIVTRLGFLTIDQPGGGGRMTLIKFAQTQVAQGVAQFSDWLQQLGPHMPNVNTPGNTSLAYSIAYVILILLLMSVLYVFKIFIKV